MLKIIGSVELCALEELGISKIDARIDTGAKTSSLQATNIEVFKRKNRKWVRFEVNYIVDGKPVSTKCENPVFTRRRVKTSNEISEKRIMIKTPMTMGEITYEIELNLANRATMEYQMLLGREALNGRFLIDPSKSFLL